MKIRAYSLLILKYVVIDAGVFLLLIVIPVYNDPESIGLHMQRATLYSGFITPVISYVEIKNSNQLPFFDNLRVTQYALYAIQLILKVVLFLIMAVYV